MPWQKEKAFSPPPPASSLRFFRFLFLPFLVLGPPILSLHLDRCPPFITFSREGNHQLVPPPPPLYDPPDSTSPSFPFSQKDFLAPDQLLVIFLPTKFIDAALETPRVQGGPQIWCSPLPLKLALPPWHPCIQSCGPPSSRGIYARLEGEMLCGLSIAPLSTSFILTSPNFFRFFLRPSHTFSEDNQLSTKDS